MSWSPKKWASMSDFNTSSVMSQSVMFSPYNHIAKCTLMQFGTKSSDSVIQASVVPGLSHVSAPKGNRLKCSVEGRHKYESTVQKSQEEILTAE
jgi:hypothetical protein